MGGTACLCADALQVQSAASEPESKELGGNGFIDKPRGSAVEHTVMEVLRAMED